MNTVGCAIYKCGKACYAKKSYVNMVEKPPLLWVIAYLKWTEANCKTVLWSNKLNFVFGNMDLVSRLKRRGSIQRGDAPSSLLSAFVTKSASLMVWWNISALNWQLTHLERHYLWCKVYKVFRATNVPIQSISFSVSLMVFFSKTVVNCIWHYNSNGLPADCLGTSWNKRYGKEDTGLLSS